MIKSLAVTLALTLSIGAWASGGFFGGGGGGGGGDVTAAASIPDNDIVRGDGGLKGIQGSGWTLDDSGHLLCKADGTCDIGSPDNGTTQNRPDEVFVKDHLQVGTSVLFEAGAFAGLPGTIYFGSNPERFGFFGTVAGNGGFMGFKTTSGPSTADFTAFFQVDAVSIPPEADAKDWYFGRIDAGDSATSFLLRISAKSGDEGGDFELGFREHPNNVASRNGGRLLNAEQVEYKKQITIKSPRFATHVSMAPKLSDAHFYKKDFAGTEYRIFDASQGLALFIAEFDAFGNLQASASVDTTEIDFAANNATQNHQAAINANNGLATGTIGAHSDVYGAAPPPIATDLLQFDGTNWIPASISLFGEANTSSNSGLGGVGIVLPKSGVDLPFKSINAASSKITVTDDFANFEVDVDVDETQLDHNNLTNYDIDEHRVINDIGIGITDLWSASKIIFELSTKASTSHGFAHHDGGTDEIDVELTGGIDTFVPANFTPSIVEAGCSATDQLCSWLKGIDLALGTGVTAHASTHVDFGSGTDVLDGDLLAITFIPSNYVRDSLTPPEANSDDDLTAHLQGIDTSIGLIAENAEQGNITTTDGTPTLVSDAAIVVGEGETVTYEQKCSAVRTDVVAGDKGYGAYFIGNFRRPVGGSTVIVGNATTVHEKWDSPGAYASEIDLTSNTLAPLVTGLLNQDVKWECKTFANRVM